LLPILSGFPMQRFVHFFHILNNKINFNNLIFSDCNYYHYIIHCIPIGVHDIFYNTTKLCDLFILHY